LPFFLFILFFVEREMNDILIGYIASNFQSYYHPSSTLVSLLDTRMISNTDIF
jgi:hypothetical protein